jgi:hypothetical protein
LGEKGRKMGKKAEEGLPEGGGCGLMGGIHR